MRDQSFCDGIVPDVGKRYIERDVIDHQRAVAVCGRDVHSPVMKVVGRLVAGDSIRQFNKTSFR
ncbi:MAG TPA: hypothetical protein VK658_01905, partial [Chryseolinea sp.]|nr:hypothetical protein [Chryseolinea sp.]